MLVFIKSNLFSSCVFRNSFKNTFLTFTYIVHSNTLNNNANYKSYNEQHYNVLRMPDGLFTYQKSQFGKILNGLGMENVCIFSM
jgi:hypothetical protein